MPTRKKSPPPKRTGRASTAKRIDVPDKTEGPGAKGASDEPQREDEFLSKFLRNSNPETKNIDGKKKG